MHPKQHFFWVQIFATLQKNPVWLIKKISVENIVPKLPDFKENISEIITTRSSISLKFFSTFLFDL